MESYINPEDIKKEFGVPVVKIKDEVFFEQIEDQSCIGDIINDIKEEKTSFDPTHVQSIASDVLKEENKLFNLIRKEDLTDSISLNDGEEFIKEEEEIDYVWPEGAIKETDPLALPIIKNETEFENTKEEETVASVSLSESSSQKDSESLRFEVHDSRGKHQNEQIPHIFSTSGKLKHKSLYTRKRPHKCNVCAYAFSSSSKLKTHMRSHSGERPYKCNECEYASSELGNLKTHMRRHTGERPYKCNECEYASFDSGTLKRHMRKHTGESPYKCNECQYSSSTLNILKIHMKKHTGEGLYKCNICKYTSFQLGNLKRHMRRHTGERPYKCNKCNECEYATSELGNLKIHMRRHTGERLYKCNECEYASCDSGTLKRHIMRKHTGERPYKCNECEYASSELGNLKRHMRCHTGE